MIISISGAEGSGKSTIAKLLAAKLGWPRYYMGRIWREKAQEKNLTLVEYQKMGETDPSIDLEIDEYQKKLGETLDDFVIEGRTSWYFIPHSFKIFLDVSLEEGAKRIFAELQKDSSRNEDKNLHSVADVMASVKARRESNNLRYEKYFKIDVYDKSHYDYVLDATNLTIDQVFEQIWQAVENRLKIINNKQ